MNQRILELALKTDEACEHLGRSDIGEEWVEKFAQLIVRECANAIINDKRLNDVRSAANGCVRTINEHFGVDPFAR